MLTSRSQRFVLMSLVFLVFAAVAERPAYAVDLTGTWEGRWKSRTNGHEGPMKATFERINASQYRVRFSGRFFTIIPFCYTETFNVISDDGRTVQMAATSKLCFFGNFHCHAAANCCHFNANYASENDQGYFKMSRTGY